MRPPLTIRYFAWLREQIGVESQSLPLPDEVRTVSGLIHYLSARDANHAAAFRNCAIIRCAVNHELADSSFPICPGDEVAFFPPITGG